MKKSQTLRLDESDLATLDTAAHRLGASRTAVIRGLIQQYSGKLRTAPTEANDPTRPGRRRTGKNNPEKSADSGI